MGLKPVWTLVRTCVQCMRAELIATSVLKCSLVTNKIVTPKLSLISYLYQTVKPTVYCNVCCLIYILPPHYYQVLEMFMGIPFPFPMGIPWEWESLAKMGMGIWEWAGMGINLHGNGNDTNSHGNLFPSSFQRMQATASIQYNSIL